MGIINFNLAKPLEQQVSGEIKTRGFASKAAFFRYVTMFYFDHKNVHTDEETRFKAAVEDLKQAIHKKYGGKKLPSLREQLADLR